MLGVSRFLLLAGCFTMPMLSFRVGGSSSSSIYGTTQTGLTVSDLFFFGSAVVLAACIRRPKVSPAPTWQLGCLLVVIGGVTASFFAKVPLSSLTVVGRMIFVLVIWLWTVRHLLIGERRVHAAMTAYVLGTAISGAVTIIQLEFHALVSLGGLVHGRAFGLSHQPDDTGNLLALGLVFAVGLAFHPRAGRRWLYFSCAALIAVGLILSGSVSGMIAAVFGCFVVLARSGLGFKRLVAIALILVCVYVAGTTIQGNNGQSLNPIARFNAAGIGQSNDSVTPRIDTMRAAWDGIVQSPVFGHGLDISSSLVYLDRPEQLEYETHNFVLMNWYGGGILYLMGEVLCIVTAFRRITGSDRRDPTKDILFAAALAVLALSMQGPTMFDRYFWFPFVLSMTFMPRPARRFHGIRAFQSTTPSLGISSQ